jgi:hypothetical protein
MYRLIIEHIVKQVLREARSASATTKAKQELLSSEYGSKFIPLTTPGRIGNKENISEKEFIEIIKDVFKIDRVETISKDTSPNPSSKYPAFIFPFEGKEAMLILAGKGRESSERQERGVIEAINSVSGEKTLLFNNTKITGVKSARKIGKVEGYKAQAYADIELDTTTGIKKISAKGLQTPSLGGAGLSGLDTLNNPIVNSFIEQFYGEVINQYKDIISVNPELKGKDLQGDKLFKDIYKQIPKEVEVPILKGTKEMGGPIDYFYVGNMDVDFVVEGSTILFDGDLFTVEEFAERGTPFFVRLLRREGPCYFTTEINPKLNNITVPKVFSIKPNGKGQTQSRIFLTNRATKKTDYQS